MPRARRAANGQFFSENREPMARRLFIQCLTLVGVFASSACDDPELNSDPGAIRFVAEAQIGSVEGPVALSLPIGALMLGTDTLLLAQLSAAHLLVLSVDGDSLGTVGRAGSGPGGFSLPMPSAVRGDSLWIIDGQVPTDWQIFLARGPGPVETGRGLSGVIPCVRP